MLDSYGVDNSYLFQNQFRKVSQNEGVEALSTQSKINFFTQIDKLSEASNSMDFSLNQAENLLADSTVESSFNLELL